MKNLIALTVAFGVAIGSPASAADGDSGDYYHIMTTITLSKCRSTMSVSLNRIAQGDSPEEARSNGNGSDGDGDWPKCLADGKKEGNALFQSALKQIRKVKAKEALKKYQAAWLAAMDGVPPAASEIRLDYRRRQAASDTKLAEAWSSVQVEL